MKRTHKIIAGLILATGIVGTASAQGNWGCNGSGPMGGMGGMGPMGRQAAAKFDPAQRAGQHLDYMKYQLKITPEQEPLWKSFADKAQAEAGKGRQAMQAQADANLSAPERMAKMQGLMEERLAAMKGVHESFGRLYAALTPEQKKIADQQAARMGKGGMGGMGGMGGRPGRMGPPVAPQG